MIKQLKSVFMIFTNQNFNTIAAKVPRAMLKPQKDINIQTCLHILKNIDQTQGLQAWYCLFQVIHNEHKNVKYLLR